MQESQAVVEARCALGRRLAACRKAAGHTQHQLASLVHYGRGSIANIETGRQHAPARFWIDADEALGAQGALVRTSENLEALIRRDLVARPPLAGTRPDRRSWRRRALAARRAAAGHSQHSLAETLGVERSTVARWESGVATPQPWVRPRLSQALGVSVQALGHLLASPDDVGGLPTVSLLSEGGTPAGSSPVGATRQSDVIATQLPSLRLVLDAHELPPDGPVRPLGELQKIVATVVSRRLHSNYVALVFELPTLLAELMRALHQRRDSQRRVVARLLMQAYRAADAIADKFGYYDLSARIIDRLQWAANETHDSLLVATAAYVRTETFFANGDLETGRRMLERAASALVPDASIRASATYGSLHMRAAVSAARAGDPVRARDHLREAARFARHTHEGVYLGTAFGPASVRIHQLSLAVELGDVGAALHTAAGWAPPKNTPAERRSHFYVDLARACLAAGRLDATLDSLMAAKSTAPEHIQGHPQVRYMVRRLRQSGVVRSSRLTDLAGFVRLAEAAS
ncbi:MAG: helix-turn-helix domain-containing protein [Micromonosporaceae bacterium]